MLPIDQHLTAEHEAAGRQMTHSEAELETYWRMSTEERQLFVKHEFEQRNAKDPYATSRDYNARELEIDSIRRQLNEKGRIVDLGCGNGYTLISLARTLPGWDLLGVDFSQNLIEGARAMLEESRAELQSYPHFICGDAIEYLKRSDADSTNYLITERFVQNMPSWEVQRDVIREAYRTLAPGGRLLLCEGSEDSFEALNDLRVSMGLSRIPKVSKDNVSAIRLKDRDVEEVARDVGFALRAKLGYSTYFIIARVLHPLLVAPQSPKFDAKINDLAREIQKHAPYQPGYGSNSLWVFEKPQARETK